MIKLKDILFEEHKLVKVVGGYPVRYEGDPRNYRAIISEPMNDRQKEDMIKRAKQAGYRAKPNMGGGVTIFVKESKINERFDFDKEDQYQVQGKTNSMMEFVKHIKNLPEELGSIKVTNSTLSFTDSSHDIEFKKRFTPSNKAQVIKIIKNITNEFKKNGDPVYEYELRSFYGTFGKRTPAENNYYITMRTKGKDDFGRRMSRGDMGPLD